MYENKVKKFENENHVVTVWEDLSTGKRCIEVIDTLDDGSSVYVETKEEVVALLEMLVKAGVMLSEGGID